MIPQPWCWRLEGSFNFGLKFNFQSRLQPSTKFVYTAAFCTLLLRASEWLTKLSDWHDMTHNIVQDNMQLDMP